MIALGIYFCFADFVLITQVLYYRRKSARERKESIVTEASEEEPLLARRQSSDIGLPGSHRRRSSVLSSTSHQSDTIVKLIEEAESDDGRPWLRNMLSILAIIAVGATGWTIAWQSGVWQPAPVEPDIPIASESHVGAKILGYISAVCYLGYVV
jgi:hypothetical protein